MHVAIGNEEDEEGDDDDEGDVDDNDDDVERACKPLGVCAWTTDEVGHNAHTNELCIGDECVSTESCIQSIIRHKKNHSQEL